MRQRSRKRKNLSCKYAHIYYNNKLRNTQKSKNAVRSERFLRKPIHQNFSRVRLGRTTKKKCAIARSQFATDFLYVCSLMLLNKGDWWRRGQTRVRSGGESPTRTAGDAEPSPWPGAEQPLAATASPLRSLQRLHPAHSPAPAARITDDNWQANMPSGSEINRSTRRARFEAAAISVSCRNCKKFLFICR